MLTLYLVCLAFGGILVAFTVLAGDGGDVGGYDADAVAPSGGHGLQAVSEFLSFRTLVFFLAFFGLTGTILTLLGGSAVVALVASLGMGAVAGIGIQKAVLYLVRSESGQGFDIRRLEGSRGRVLLGCSRRTRGKISVDLHDRTMQLLAQVAEEAGEDSFAPGDAVVVVSVRDGVAYVSGEEIVR